jgi:uncharacterized protein (DUF169 family)
MKVREVADSLTRALELETAPIALARTDGPPAGVPVLQDTVPSACALWRRAERGVFYATAERHFNCPVGAMVMGFELSPQSRDQLMGLVGMMVNEGYLGGDEAAHIPVLPTPRPGAVYGPLRDFPIEPDFVVMWLKPRQAMLAAEATGSSHWTLTEPSRMLGRPACAALPVSQSRRTVALSLGCTGLRTYAEVADDRLLAVVPGTEAEAFGRTLDTTLNANRSMTAFYEHRKAECR